MKILCKDALVAFAVGSFIACGVPEEERQLSPSLHSIDGRSAVDEGEDFDYLVEPGVTAEGLQQEEAKLWEQSSEQHFSAAASGQYFCPQGFAYDGSSRLCVSDREAVGPFPWKMRQACIAAKGGDGCEKDKWNKGMAVWLRGKGACPAGSYKNQKGLCTDGKHAYGPFTTAQVEKCRAASGGDACESLRWSLKFAESTIGETPVAPDRGSSGKLKGLRVAIDVGHGNAGECYCFDPGAVNPSDRARITEYNYNLKMGKAVKDKLEALGATVTLSYYPKDRGNFKSLSAKGNFAGGHDIFMSLHHNASRNRSAQGSEVFTRYSPSWSDTRLASALQKELVRSVWAGARTKDRGVKAAGFSILYGVPSSVPARVLVESWFLDHYNINFAEAERLLKRSIDGLVNGVVAYHSR